MLVMTNPSSPSPIDIASKRNTHIFAAYIIVLVVTALIIALFTWLTWDAGNKVQDAVQQDANARIGEAKVTAAQADERSKTLEQSNLQLQGQVAVLQKGASDAESAQQRVEIELSKQKEQTAIAEKDLAQLKLAIQPRRLSSEQRSALIGFLHGTPGSININCILGDEEGKTFAGDIADTFIAAGWTVNGPSQISPPGSYPRGIEILVRSANVAPVSATRAQQAFFSIGIPLSGAQEADMPDGLVTIFVGPKPTPK